MGNFERMIALVNDVFASREDPEQLDVDEEVIARLQKIHPATLAEYDDGNGPAAWILVFPTSLEHMHLFLNNELSEKQLFELTVPGAVYEAIYLCSAIMLEEYRGKGLAKKMTMESITAICADHPVQYLYVWPFTDDGNNLAAALAKVAQLPLLTKAYDAGKSPIE